MFASSERVKRASMDRGGNFISAVNLLKGFVRLLGTWWLSFVLCSVDGA